MDSQPGNALAYTFHKSSGGNGPFIWNIEGTSFTGDTLLYSLPAPGTYTVCITVVGICEEAIACQDIAWGSRAWRIPARVRRGVFGRCLHWTCLLYFASEERVELYDVLDASGHIVLQGSLYGEEASTVKVAILSPGPYVLRMRTASGPIQHCWIKR